jgi:hypothetical protein
MIELPVELLQVLNSLGQDTQEMIARDLQEESKTYPNEFQPPIDPKAAELAEAIIAYVGMADLYPLSGNWRG